MNVGIGRKPIWSRYQCIRQNLKHKASISGRSFQVFQITDRLHPIHVHSFENWTTRIKTVYIAMNIFLFLWNIQYYIDKCNTGISSFRVNCLQQQLMLCSVSLCQIYAFGRNIELLYLLDDCFCLQPVYRNYINIYLSIKASIISIAHSNRTTMCDYFLKTLLIWRSCKP